MAKFLEPFKFWTDFIEADTKITIHKVVPVQIKMMKHLVISSETDPEILSSKNYNIIEDMKSLGREYIRKRKDEFQPTQEQHIAFALHPRCKKMKTFGNSDRERIYAMINTLITNDIPPSSNVNVVEIRAKKHSQNLLDDFADSDNDDISDINTINYSKELDEYLRVMIPTDAGFYQNDDSQALSDWWFKHRQIFPSLFKLFMKISAIPAASAPSERGFSLTGQIISNRRSCILPKNVSNIVMCRNLYQK